MTKRKLVVPQRIDTASERHLNHPRGVTTTTALEHGVYLEVMPTQRTVQLD